MCLYRPLYSAWNFDKAGRVFDQPGLGKGIPAHCRVDGTGWSPLSLPAQPILWFKKTPSHKPKTKEARNKKQPSQKPRKQWNNQFITLKILDLGFIFQDLMRKQRSFENWLYGSTVQMQMTTQAKTCWCWILLLDDTFSDFNALNHFLA